MKKLLLATFYFLIFASCKSQDLSGSNLEISLGPQAQYILNISFQTCAQEAKHEDGRGVQANSFQLRKFQYKWTGSNEYEMVSLQIDLKSSDLEGGKALCFLTGDDLGYTLKGSPFKIQGGDTTTYSSGCSVRCGGIKFKDTVKSSFINGTAKVFGYETTTDGDMIPVFSESEVSLQYQNF